VRAEGTDAFKARINQHAQPLADYFFQQLTEEADPRSLEGKAHMVTLAAPLIDKVPGANLRTLMRQRLTEITGLTEGQPTGAKRAAPQARPPTTPASITTQCPTTATSSNRTCTCRSRNGPRKARCRRQKVGKQTLGQERAWPSASRPGCRSPSNRRR
jgi:DNA primase